MIKDNLKFLKMLEFEFDFVLLAEFFDESLVILAKRFCWDLKQVMKRKNWKRNKSQVRYLRQNSRRKETVSKISLETQEALEVRP